MGDSTTTNIRGFGGDQRAKELEGLDFNSVIALAVDTARDYPQSSDI